MFLFSEIEYNNNLLSINNTVVCETSITCDHIYNKLDYNTRTYMFINIFFFNVVAKAMICVRLFF